MFYTMLFDAAEEKKSEDAEREDRVATPPSSPTANDRPKPR